MMDMIFDDEGFLEEPCISCDKSYVDDLFYEWHCDEKECPYKKEKEVNMRYKVVRPNFIAYTIAATPGRAASNLNYRFKKEHGRWPEDLITADEVTCLGPAPPTDLIEQVWKEALDGQMVMNFDGLIFNGYSSKGVSRVKEEMI